MTKPTLDTLTRRLDRLEREVRWWRFTVVAASGLLLGLVALVGAAKPGTALVADEVKAKRFLLVDDAGREHARLGMGIVGVLAARLEPELCLGDKEKSGTCLYPYGLSTRASDNGFVNLNPMGLRIALGKVEVEINSGLGIGGPRLALSGPSPALVLDGNDGKVVWKAP